MIKGRLDLALLEKWVQSILWQKDEFYQSLTHIQVPKAHLDRINVSTSGHHEVDVGHIDVDAVPLEVLRLKALVHTTSSEKQIIFQGVRELYEQHPTEVRWISPEVPSRIVLIGRGLRTGLLKVSLAASLFEQ